MRKTALFLGFFLVLAPGLVFAQTPSCSAQGYTVIFVNGIWDTQPEAQVDNNELEAVFDRQNNGLLNGQQVSFYLGYNATHLAGGGDLVQAFAQQFSSSVSDFNLDTILGQIYPEVTTRKLLIVGHSQGAEYANEMYDYLLAHGEPKEAVGVYAVATPASYVAGGGNYITSDTDKVINEVSAVAATANALGAHVPVPLPANAAFTLTPEDLESGIGGHMFADDYLAQGAPQIQSDIDGELSNLQPTDASQTGDCFTQPNQSLAYKTESAAFAVADPTASVIKTGTVAVADASAVAFNAATKVATGALQMFADTITVTTAPPTGAQTNTDTMKVINKLYGSSLSGLSAQDQKDLLGTSQGGAVVLATVKPAPASVGVVLGTSTEAVSIATTTPLVPKSIFPQSSNGPVWGGGAGGGSSAALAPAVVTDNTIDDTVADDDIPVDPEISTTTVTTIAGPMVDFSNPPVVINEIEWAGDMFDGGREWIELKNRTANDIDLSKYVLYAADGGSQYIQLAGILPGNTSGQPYFVIERDPSAPFVAGTAQVQVAPFDQLADSGEQLALARVDDTGTTTIDMTPALGACTGWCAGSGVSDANQGETLSMERVSADALGTDPSNWASNDRYSVSETMPPPSGQPWKANGLPLYATPLSDNSAHLPDAGWLCSGDSSTNFVTTGIGRLVVPTNDGSTQVVHGIATNNPISCAYLARFVGWPTTVGAGLFKGIVGSSTLVTMKNSSYPGFGIITSYFSGDGLEDAQPGDQYFIAIWEYPLSGFARIDANAAFESYFTAGHGLMRDPVTDEYTDSTDTNPPSQIYRVIPFIYEP